LRAKTQACALCGAQMEKSGKTVGPYPVCANHAIFVQLLQNLCWIRAYMAATLSGALDMCLQKKRADKTDFDGASWDDYWLYLLGKTLGKRRIDKGKRINKSLSTQAWPHSQKPANYIGGAIGNLYEIIVFGQQDLDDFAE
jgi:hypothetical protein